MFYSVASPLNRKSAHCGGHAVCLCVFDRMSQVTKPYAEPSTATGKPPVGAIVLSESPKIVVAGDAFLGSTFDNCLLSAKSAAEIIVKGSAISSGL